MNILNTNIITLNINPDVQQIDFDSWKKIKYISWGQIKKKIRCLEKIKQFQKVCNQKGFYVNSDKFKLPQSIFDSFIDNYHSKKKTI